MKQTALIKPPKNRFVGVLVDIPLYKRIYEAATRENRSVSQFVRLLIEQALAEPRKKDKA